MGYFIAILFLAVPAAMWRGYVLSVIWSWFIVTTFGLPELTIVQAIGLSIVVGYFKMSYNTKKEQNEERTDIFARFIGHAFFAPLFVLGFAWIVKGFM